VRGVVACLGIVVVLAAAVAEAQQHAAASQTVGPRDLAQVADLDGLGVSPDGEWAAFQVRRPNVETNSYESAWYVAPTDGSSPALRIADAGEPIQPVILGRINGAVITPAPVWSPENGSISYIKRTNGRDQVWRTQVDGTGTEQLTSNRGDVITLVASKSGAKLYFTTKPSQIQVEELLALDGKDGFLFDERFIPSYSPLPLVAHNGEDVWTYDLSSKREMIATHAEEKEYISITRLAPPRNRPAYRANMVSSPHGALAWTEARDPERQGGMAPLTIAAQPAAATSPIVCDAAECTSQSIRGIWWRNEHELVFATGEGRQLLNTALYSWRPGPFPPRLIMRTDSLLIPSSQSQWKCGVSQRWLTCFYEQSDYPARVVATDLESGAIRVIHDPNPSFVEFDLGRPPERIEIQTRSGVMTYGYLVLPPRSSGRGRLPLVVVTYGCSGFLRGGTGNEYPIFPFASRGLAVFCLSAPSLDPDRLATMDWASYQTWLRGPGEPEKARAQEALEAAITYLDRRGVIDPKRVGITGLSFGAEMVSYAIMRMPQLRAAIASGSEIGPSGVFLYGETGRASLRNWGLVGPSAHARWKDMSLALNATKVRTPLLLNVPDHELYGSLEPVTALEEANRAVEMHIFPNEYHIKSQPVHRLAIYQRNLDWMNFWLRDVEDSDAAKNSQYRRWRKMREQMDAQRADTAGCVGCAN
jgi:prolyl oligopeptidase family protein